MKTLSSVVSLVLLVVATTALADGTETLGPLSIPVATGSGIAIGGIGLELAQPGIATVEVPAGATVKQVLLYWGGFYSANPGVAADTMGVTVNGIPVIGNKIGGPTFFFSGAYPTAYRADITTMGVIGPGTNNLSIGGLSFTAINHGAGVLVIYDDGTVSTVGVLDGVDTAFVNFPAPRQTTVEQSFSFPSHTAPRTANLAIFAASVEGNDLPGLRPNVIKVTVGENPPLLFVDQLNSNDGDEWDSLVLPIDIPAGVTSLKIQLISEDHNTTGYLPASLVWIGASLAIAQPRQECTGAIGDLVWYDMNLNGLQDTGEPGIPDVQVRLLNGEGVMIALTTTDQDGLYLFSGLCAGSYQVCVDIATLPAGFVPTASMVGNDRSIDSDGSCASVVLEADGDSDLTIDFGYGVYREICGHTIGFWKTNAAKDLKLQKGNAQVTLTAYYALLGCVVDTYSLGIADWTQWQINKPIGTLDLKWAYRWLAYGAYDPVTGKKKPESSDPMVKARGQLTSLMLTSCYKGSDYTGALMEVPGLGTKSVADWTVDAIQAYNGGNYAMAHKIAVSLNEGCARIPVIIDVFPPVIVD